VRPDLPAGTVTFLFTDIEGSTRLLHEHGDAYADLLAEHRLALRAAVEANGGVEVDTQGDAFFVAFPSAGQAAAAAEAAQEALAGGPIRVRMGLHTGEPVVTAEGYVGLDVHRGARICSAAHGGQVVLSARTRELLPTGGAVRDLGFHRLKDFSREQQLFQLGDEDFPPLRSLNATNLPTQPSALVGRESELADLIEIVGGHRLVTLTGPGGSGKTRLALQLAAELVSETDGGVFWVPLAAVNDPLLVESAIAQALGGGDDLEAHIGRRRMLLLLDNFEQVLEAATDVSVLLRACPALRVIVTSRAPLRIEGEREFGVAPLPEAAAVELFCARASIVEPDDAVVAICRRLDGLPLALELAAARTRLLAPVELLGRLDRALPLLTAGRRDAPERQRTLRATILWSYDLLSGEEQRLFARLGVFAGSFTLEAAELVCEAGLETVESLLEQSLLRRWASGRLGMLETIRELAAERLDESGEAEVVRRAHAEWCLKQAEASGLSLESAGKRPQRHDLVLAEQDNIRAALDWTVGSDPELGLRIATAVENFWITNDPAEGMRRFQVLLERADGVDLLLRARALRDLGGSAQMSGHLDEAEAAYRESGELFGDAGDEGGSATILFRFASLAVWQGDDGLADSLSAEALEAFERTGDAIGKMQVLGNLGSRAFDHGNLERARELHEASLALAREARWRWWEGGELLNVGEISLVEGREADAEPYAKEALAIGREIGDREDIVYALAQLAWLAASRGEDDRALALWSAVEAEASRQRLPRWFMDRDRYAAHVPSGPLPPPLSLDEAVELGLSLP
jgi:predicted ATPase/class 3 adenylate cyclase